MRAGKDPVKRMKDKLQAASRVRNDIWKMNSNIRKRYRDSFTIEKMRRANKHMKPLQRQPLEKCQLKPQWETITQLLQQLKWKLVITPIASGEDVEKLGLISWWTCKMVQPLWKTVWQFLVKLNLRLAGCTLGHLS